MRIFKIISLVLLLPGCNFSKDSFESRSFNSKLGELFFDANVRSRYDNLVSYFKTVSNLKELNSGWTIYPPLSALRQAEDNIGQKTFEFHSYLDQLSGFRSGILSIRKIGPDKDALAALEITLEFKLEKDAERVYKTITSDFSTLPLDKEVSTLESFRSTVIHDNESNTVFKISVFNDKVNELYAVTLRLISSES